MFFPDIMVNPMVNPTVKQSFLRTHPSETRSLAGIAMDTMPVSQFLSTCLVVVLCLVPFTGGLAYPDDQEVRRIAVRALDLFDKDPLAPGACHAQSKRFLSNDWTGLNSEEPPLRPIMEDLATGVIKLSNIAASDGATERSFIYWISSFRLVLVSEDFELTDSTLVLLILLLPLPVGVSGHLTDPKFFSLDWTLDSGF